MRKWSTITVGEFVTLSPKDIKSCRNVGEITAAELIKLQGELSQYAGIQPGWQKPKILLYDGTKESQAKQQYVRSLYAEVAIANFPVVTQADKARNNSLHSWCDKMLFSFRAVDSMCIMLASEMAQLSTIYRRDLIIYYPEAELSWQCPEIARGLAYAVGIARGKGATVVNSYAELLKLVNSENILN